MPPFFRRHWVSLTLLVILLTAGWMRLNGRNWDGGTDWHPDERHVVFDGTMANLNWPTGTTFNQLLDAWHSPINPRMNHQSPGTAAAWVYGTLPVYIVKLVSWGASLAADGINTLAGAYIPGTHVFATGKQITIPGGQIIPQWDGKIPSGNYFLDGAGVFQSGRTMANLFDLFTVFLVFLIGRRLYGPNAGLLAAAFSAFAVTQIQISNFFIVEPFLVTFMTGMLYFSVVLMQRPGFWPALGAGLCLGFALACKVSVVPLGLVIVVALVLRAASRKHTRRLGPDPAVADPVGLRPADKAERERSFGGALVRLLPLLVVAILATIIAFFLGDPYAFLQWNHPPDFDLARLSQGIRAYLDGLGNEYLRQLLIEADNQSGVADVPFTRQFIGTIPGVYHLQQVVQWGMGPASGLVALAAMFWGLWRAIKGRAAELLLLSASVVYFATIATLEAKWPRYMLPIVPYLCILAAGLLVAGLAWSRRAGLVEKTDEWARAASIRGQEYRESLGTVVRRWAFPVITTVAVLGSLAWAVAWQSIYSQPFSAVQSAQWIADNVPSGAVLGQESWDETQPIGLVNGQRPAARQVSYGGTSFDMYNDRPSQAEFEFIKGLLQQTDYIVENSNRIYKTIPKLPWRYPVQTRYYELLFQEKLGFKLVHTSQVAPSIFGITIDDQGADESYTVYDHPKIYIFQKTSDLSDDELATLFGKSVEKPSLSIRHAANPYDKSLLLDQPVGQTMALGDYNWNPIAQNQWIGLLLWLLVLEGFGLLAWPLVAVVCRRLPDRGYPLAKITGLLVVSWLTWLAASAHLLPFTVWSIGAATVLLGLLSLMLWRRMAGELGSFLRTHARLVLGWEALFLGAFAFFTIVRIFNPDLWQPWQGGEKPMEFAFLNGILRSPYMPPIDSFFAGGYINYYYYGQFMVALLIKFVGLDSAVGYNLAIPTFYAMVAVGAACVVYNCVTLVQRARGWKAPASGTAFGFGLLGSFLLIGIGNLAGAAQYVASAFPTLAAAVLPILVKLNLLSAEFTNPAPGSAYSFWAPSRVIGAANGPGHQTTINEFPFWTFLFADLHPHLISLAFTILVAALALNLMLGAWRWPVLRAMDQATIDDTATVPATPGATVSGMAVRTGWSQALVQLWGAGPLDAILRFGLTALALGSLAAINTWDFPTYAGLTGIALVAAVMLAWRAAGNRTISMRVALLVAAGAGAIVVTVAALFLYAPFFLSFKTVAVSGGSPIRFIEVGDPARPWMRRTYLSEFLSIWGLFIFIAGSYLAQRLWHFPWREAVTDWGRWVGGVGRLSPEGSAAPPERPPVPAPLPPLRDLGTPGLPSEGSYSSVLSPSNGHSADAAGVAGPLAVPEPALSLPISNGHSTDADEVVVPGPAQPLPSFGFMPGFEPLDTIPGDGELEPGLHAATALEADTAPVNGTDEGANHYALDDSGALGQDLDDDEVFRHNTRQRHNAFLSPLHDETNDYTGEATGYDTPADLDAEPVPPATRRSVPLDRPDREPTYTVRVPADALAVGSDDAPAEAVEAPADYTNDELTHHTAPDDAASPVGDPAPLEPHPIAQPAPLEAAPVLAFAASASAGDDAGTRAEGGDAPAPFDDEPETIYLFGSPEAVDDEPEIDAPSFAGEPDAGAEPDSLPATPDEAAPDDGSIHVAPASEDMPASDSNPLVEAESVEPSATVSNVVESPADRLLTMSDMAPPPPSPVVVAEPRQRGVVPAGIGLLLLGLTGVAVLGLLVKQEWLLALLTLLIGGLVATHLDGVRAPGTLFGGLLLVVGLGVAMAVEVVYLADFLAGGDTFRMNTVFKFYMQVWVLLSMGSAVAIYSMIGPQGARLIRRVVPAPAAALPVDASGAVFPTSVASTTEAPAEPPAPADPADYLAFMPPANRDAATAPVEDDDPLGWLVPPGSSTSVLPPMPAAPDRDAAEETADPLIAPVVSLDVDAAPEAADTPPSDDGAVLVDPNAVGADSVPVDAVLESPDDATPAPDDTASPFAPSTDTPTISDDAPLSPDADETNPTPPSNADTSADDGAVLVDPNAVGADSVPVDAVLESPNDATPAPDADEDNRPEPPPTRPGLGPGTYDPDALSPPGKDDAEPPANLPTVPPTWSDPEGAAIADAAEEQASLPAEPGEVRLEGHEIVTHDAPVEADVPVAPSAEPPTGASLIAGSALSAARRVRRPPVRRPPAAALPPADAPLASPAEAVAPATPDAGPVEEPASMAAPLPAVDDGGPLVAAEASAVDQPADESPIQPLWTAPVAAVPGSPDYEPPEEAPAGEVLPMSNEEPLWTASAADTVPPASDESQWAVPVDGLSPASDESQWAAPAADVLPVSSDESLWAALAADLLPASSDESQWAAPAAELLPPSGDDLQWAAPAADTVSPWSGEAQWVDPAAYATDQPTRVLTAAPLGPVVVAEREALEPRSGPFRAGVKTVWYVLFAILLLASFVFTVVGTQARVADRFPDRTQWPALGTLNGMDWMNDAQLQLCFNGNQTCGTIIYKFEREALDWLRTNVNGAPVVADDPHDYYRESGCMVATYTGLPILLGPQHEGEQRYDWQVSERSGDAEEFFRTDSVDRARILIAKYDIVYIYVGQVVRISRRDIPGAVSKFDDMVQANLLEVAYKNTAVTIYKVKQAAGQLGSEPGKPRPSPTPKPTPTEPPLGTDPKLIALEAAVQQNPTDAAARLELGSYYRDHKNFSKAVVQFQEVLKLSPRDVSTYQTLGDTLQEMGDDAGALAAWEEAVKQVPDNPDAHNKVGIAYSSRGRYDDAIREFSDTVRLNPKFVEASFHLGEVYEVLQQKDKAIQAYQAVIANGADTDWVRQAQTKINGLK